MGKLASVRQRIGGGLVDLVLSFVFIFIFAWITGLAETPDTEAAVSISIEGWPFILACLIVFALFAVMEAFLGKTPGKFIAGTRVVDEAGNRIGLVPALIRNLLRFIDGFAFYLLGLIVVLVDKGNRRLGDMAAKGRVVADG